MTSIGSLALSSFISRSIYGVFDWRPVLICVTSDVITIGLDHYNDQAAALVQAKKTADATVISVFTRARLLLLSSATLLVFALLMSPISTWLITMAFITPAILWDTTLFHWNPSSGAPVRVKKTKQAKAHADRNGFVIKRIPGMKAVFIGIIRGCGTFAVVHSILSRSFPTETTAAGLWTPMQIVVWSTINRTCHAVMADVRDFTEDWELQVPTIPVLLKSVFKTKILLTTMHAATILAFYQNAYIVFASLYATALVWVLDENSPRKLYRLSFHSQTLVAVVYVAIEVYKRYQIVV
ncbi:uncharacterized protein LAESUDRAFT_745874 [Laetiporus sulphureus 93-53]|uniref:UbiA prenyltransferase n=1 Tax=Laetiporus sulphureus 93-53 TaxID=1314785 RepID=A0A165B6D0_9APHY|nr:uncharacterized protein LAESUDRAFT_745874 [Laetiporus sulphureus 93-53]KZT00343.1 hypothetical protein LAESUDRAFT_745874 [Laetiporus sulphureus 93-53]